MGQRRKDHTQKTTSGHRRYDISKLKPEMYREHIKETRKTIAYAKVSSHDQKADLERQKQVLELYCARQGWTYEIRWFISVQVEIQDPMPIHTTISENQAIGVDLGVKDLAVLSDGTKIIGAKPYNALLSRVRRLNQSLSRKQGAKKGEKKSKNFKKTQMKLSKLHAKIADIRNDETHRLTAMLSESYSIIGIEDLIVSGMAKNHKLARAVLDMSFFEFRRQLEYKTKMKGGHVIIADRFYPPSKTCSSCGYKNNDLTLSVREWTCPRLWGKSQQRY